jgi:hypothetical protein
VILRKVSAAAPKVFAGLFLAMPIAFAFDLLTAFAGFHMPGIIVAGMVGDTFINRGLQWRLIYGIWVAVATDAVFLFIMFSILYLLWHRFREGSLK